MKFVDPFRNLYKLRWTEIHYSIRKQTSCRSLTSQISYLILVAARSKPRTEDITFNKPLNDRIIFTLKILNPNFAISKAKENSRRSQISQKKQKRKTRKSALNNSVIWRRPTIVSTNSANNLKFVEDKLEERNLKNEEIVRTNFQTFQANQNSNFSEGNR